MTAWLCDLKQTQLGTVNLCCPRFFFLSFLFFSCSRTRPPEPRSRLGCRRGPRAAVLVVCLYRAKTGTGLRGSGHRGIEQDLQAMPVSERRPATARKRPSVLASCYWQLLRVYLAHGGFGFISSLVCLRYCLRRYGPGAVEGLWAREIDGPPLRLDERFLCHQHLSEPCPWL